MSSKNQKPSKRRFKLLNPEQWGLDPSKTYVFVETEKGFALRITKDGWIGLPKSHVESNPGIFKPVEYEPKRDI